MTTDTPRDALLPDGTQALANRSAGQLWIYVDPALSTDDAARVRTIVIAHVQKVAR